VVDRFALWVRINTYGQRLLQKYHISKLRLQRHAKKPEKMSVTSELTSETSKPPIKRKAGGFRPGSGRKPGTLNRSTLARQERIRKEVEAALATVPPEQVDGMDAFGTMEFALRAYLRANNLAAAVSVAKELLPYERPKKASTTHEEPLPADLLGDPTPAPDEPVPDLIE